MDPFRCESYLRPMVWGGERIARVLGKTTGRAEPIGEAWEVSDHPTHLSVIATGPWSGRTLRSVMESDAASLLGAAAAEHARFPWLIKILDANDWLSVQVHPDTETVKRLWPGEGSKTEVWFVIDAAPTSRIYAGLLPGVDERALRDALERGTVAECLHSFTPQPGDCVFLPAGTVHAVGGGVGIVELQQTSDATFRLFDWNRRDAQGKSRPLHIEQSLAALHWNRGSVEPVRVPEFAQEQIKPLRRALVRCPFFALDYVAAVEPFELPATARLQALMVLRGQARLCGAGVDVTIGRGEAWVLPAGISNVHCTPIERITMLHAELPKSE